jgi:hypothetical protein
MTVQREPAAGVIILGVMLTWPTFTEMPGTFVAQGLIGIMSENAAIKLSVGLLSRLLNCHEALWHRG